MSCCRQVRFGCALEADFSISDELSSPVIEAVGQRSARTAVLLPGPQPRSITLRGAETSTRTARSRHGRVRSSANLRYCPALHVDIVKNAGRKKKTMAR